MLTVAARRASHREAAVADRIAPLALAREMHNAIPGSRFALLGGGHLIALLPHRQQQYVATVLGFLPPSKPPTAA